MPYVENKVALITGGASGIGLAIAEEFLKSGIKGVTIVDVDAENGEKTIRRLSKEFGENRVLFVKTDVTRQEDVEGAFKRTIAVFQNVDILVNSAGICKESEWEKEIAINLNGTVRVCLLAFEKYLPTYKSGNEAVIVNISSTGGLCHRECLPVYSATKHAIIGFSRSLGTSNHYKRARVRVLTICPGETDTPLITNVGKNLLGPYFEKLYAEALADYQLQKPQEVAKVVMRAIDEGKNGSVWFVRAGKIGEVKFPDSIELVED